VARDYLFKPVSPAVGWFLLAELLTLGGIVNFWVEFFRNSSRLIFPPEIWSGILLTVLFVGSNILLFRRRRLAIAGFIVTWILLAATLLPAIGVSAKTNFRLGQNDLTINRNTSSPHPSPPFGMEERVSDLSAVASAKAEGRVRVRLIRKLLLATDPDASGAL
jgi:hypothetical protein